MNIPTSDQRAAGRSTALVERTPRDSGTTGASRLTRMLTNLVLTLGFGYLVWRSSTLGRGWILALSLPLVWAESWSLIQLGLLRYQIVGRRRSEPTGQPVDLDAVDVIVVVDADSTPRLLEPTLVALAAAGWSRPVRLLARSPLPNHQPLLDRFEATSSLRFEVTVDPTLGTDPLASMVNIGAGEWILWLAAGQVPMPELFTHLGDTLIDDRTGVRQFPVGLLSPNTLFHLKSGGDEDALERQVIGPSLARRGVAPWRGPASLIRRKALVDVSHETPFNQLVPEWAVAMHCNGWSTDYDPKLLIRAQAPDSLQAYLVERRNRSAAELVNLGAAFSRRGVPGPSRMAALAGGVSLTHGIHQIAMLALLVVVLITGRLPFVGNTLTVAGAMIGFAGLTTLARHRLSGGTMAPGDWLRHGWRTLGADLAALAPQLSPLPALRDPKRASARRHAFGQMRLLVVALTFFEVVLATRALNTVYPTFLPSMSRLSATLVLVVSLTVTYTMVDVLGVLVTGRQRRRAPRISLEVDVAMAGRRGTTIDVTPFGLGARIDSAPALGETVPVRFVVPGREEDHQIETPAVVRSAFRSEAGDVRVGVEFEDLSDDDRLVLIEYCALASDEPADGSTVQAGPGDLMAEVDNGNLGLIRLLTAVATAAAVVAIFLGPVADPASADTEGAMVPVTLTLAAPSLPNIDGTDTRTDNGATNGATVGTEAVDGLTVTQTGIEVRYFTDAWSEVVTPDDDGRFNRPDSLESYVGEVMVEVRLGPDRHVIAAPGDGTLVLSRLRIEPGTEGAELTGPGQRTRPAVDGELLVPGRYVVRLPVPADAEIGTEPVVVRIEVAAGQTLVVGTDGTRLESAGIGSPGTGSSGTNDSEPSDGSTLVDESDVGVDSSSTTAEPGSTATTPSSIADSDPTDSSSADSDPTDSSTADLDGATESTVGTDPTGTTTTTTSSSVTGGTAGSTGDDLSATGESSAGARGAAP